MYCDIYRFIKTILPNSSSNLEPYETIQNIDQMNLLVETLELGSNTLSLPTLKRPQTTTVPTSNIGRNNLICSVIDLVNSWYRSVCVEYILLCDLTLHRICDLSHIPFIYI